MLERNARVMHHADVPSLPQATRCNLQPARRGHARHVLPSVWLTSITMASQADTLSHDTQEWFPPMTVLLL